ncbi:MAG: class I SAM-dependent methyltransferase [Bacteroidales bacterium]|nr:class I SAM-dependent methyltransferase [Bacteroidales bacterium]
MNKIRKLTKALGRIIRHPYLLNLILLDENSNREEVIRKYGLSDGLPVIEIDGMFPDFEETAKPYAYLSGATMPIDIALLRALARRYEVKDYFEIGTWRGESVANMAEIVRRCVTLNLPKEEIVRLTGNRSYADLHSFFSKGMNNVEQLYGDSQTYDFKSHFGQYDMVFVDGDHHYESVRKDTETAFRLLRDGRSIIVWHDYGLDPETIRWDVMGAILDGTPAEKRKHIYHISNTLCAAYLPEDFDTHPLVPYETPHKYFEINIKTHRC